MINDKSYTIFEIIKLRCEQTKTKFVTDRCKVCGTGLGYVYENESFYFDSVCKCENKGSVEIRSHSEVLDFIRDNMEDLKEITNKNSVFLS